MLHEKQGTGGGEGGGGGDWLVSSCELYSHLAISAILCLQSAMSSCFGISTPC